MIIAYILFFILGIIVFFLMAKFGLPIRIFSALAIFLIPSVALTFWVAWIGDSASDDAIVIESNKASNDDEHQESD